MAVRFLQVSSKSEHGPSFFEESELNSRKELLSLWLEANAKDNKMIHKTLLIEDEDSLDAYDLRHEKFSFKALTFENFSKDAYEYTQSLLDHYGSTCNFFPVDEL